MCLHHLLFTHVAGAWVLIGEGCLYFRKTNIFAEFNFFTLSVLLWTDTPLMEHSSWNNLAAVSLREVSRPRRQGKSSFLFARRILSSQSCFRLWYFITKKVTNTDERLCKTTTNSGSEYYRKLFANPWEPSEESCVISDVITGRSALQKTYKAFKLLTDYSPAYSLFMI